MLNTLEMKLPIVVHGPVFMLATEQSLDCITCPPVASMPRFNSIKIGYSALFVELCSCKLTDDLPPDGWKGYLSMLCLFQMYAAASLLSLGPPPTIVIIVNHDSMDSKHLHVYTST